MKSILYRIRMRTTALEKLKNNTYRWNRYCALMLACLVMGGGFGRRYNEQKGMKVARARKMDSM